MPITCRECAKVHDIEPLSYDEVDLCRVLLLGDSRKSYFCDLLCYYRYTSPNTHNGKRELDPATVKFDKAYQAAHPFWKPVHWLNKL
jgi:hypothetical protein